MAGNQVTYDSEQTQKKSVRYIGTDTLQEGNLLCYDANFAGADATAGKTGDATVNNQLRATRVEKPAAGNLEHFAGAVATGFGGIVGPANIDIFVPTARGQKIPIWTDQNCTIDVTVLTLQPGSYAAGGQTDGHRIGKALQTVDRSSTENTVQAILQAPVIVNDEVLTASSRTTVQLPTVEIWRNFPLHEMRINPFLGSLLETDFRHGDGIPANTFVDATYAALAAGKTITEAIRLGTVAIGELQFFTTTDDQAAEAQWDCPIVLSGGQPWAFEVRIKQSLITDTLADYFIGLSLGQNLVGDMHVTATGVLQAEGSLGFQLKQADGNAIDLVYDETGQTQNEHDDDFVVPAADTYNTFGLYFDGTTIQPYLDGVKSGSVIIATDISAADFPTAKVFVPTFSVRAANAADFIVTIDWLRVAQL